MAEFHDYSGCRIIIYDEEKRSTIAETEILDYNMSTHIIALRRSRFRRELSEHVSVLIFSLDALFEYKGTVRKKSSLSDTVEIALYKGAVKEDRAAIRYTIDSIAVVDHYIIANKLVPLRIPQEVLVRNVSTAGCLIRGSSQSFNYNTSFQIRLGTPDQPIVLYATVLRVKLVDSNTAEFGCRFRPAPSL